MGTLLFFRYDCMHPLTLLTFRQLRPTNPFRIASPRRSCSRSLRAQSNTPTTSSSSPPTSSSKSSTRVGRRLSRTSASRYVLRFCFVLGADFEKDMIHDIETWSLSALPGAHFVTDFPVLKCVARSPV